MRSHFGIRPDEPVIKTAASVDPTAPPVACTEYQEYSAYAQQLQETYHSRASQNRVWIYVAGILGLGIAAASGGLGVAAAAGAGTIALLSISGGFSAAAFATINNSDLAEVYTISANSVDCALRQSNATFGARYGDQVACGEALQKLKEGVSKARTTLEQSRTNNAVAALVRAKEQRKTIDDLIKRMSPPANAGDPAPPAGSPPPPPPPC